MPAFWWGRGYLWIGIGNVAAGLCGGMALAVRDRFERGEPPPPDSTSPPAGSPLFGEIARRQVDSFGRLAIVPGRLYLLALACSEAARVRATMRESRRIRATIDAGRLAPLGLLRTASPWPLRLGLNHQVLAFGYQATADRLTLSIYDPNYPDRDDVTLSVDRTAGKPRKAELRQSTGEPLLAFVMADPAHAHRNLARPSVTIPG